MKYTLYKELLDPNKTLSHVFFNCALDFIPEIAKRNEGLSEEKRAKVKIDIELKIDGHVCDPKKFFDTLYQQYSAHVEEVAEGLVKEKLSEKFTEIINKLEDYKEIVDRWSSEINWDVPNPLTENTK